MSEKSQTSRRRRVFLTHASGARGPPQCKGYLFLLLTEHVLQKETALNIAQCVRGRTFPPRGKTVFTSPGVRVCLRLRTGYGVPDLTPALLLSQMLARVLKIHKREQKSRLPWCGFTSLCTRRMGRGVSPKTEAQRQVSPRGAFHGIRR